MVVPRRRWAKIWNGVPIDQEELTRIKQEQRVLAFAGKALLYWGGAKSATWFERANQKELLRWVLETIKRLEDLSEVEWIPDLPQIPATPDQVP